MRFLFKKKKNIYPNYMNKTVIAKQVEGREDLNGKVAKIVGTYGHGVYDALFDGECSTMGVFAKDLQLLED